MASFGGELEKFDINGDEPFENYKERVEFYCQYKQITDATIQKATFLSAMGPDTYAMVKNLCTPAKPSEKTLKELTDMIEDHLSPKKNVIMERFRFNSRNRKEGESVKEYIVELKKLVRDCKYGDKLNEMIRDRLVCGIGDVTIQRKMLMKEDLTYDDAVKIAVGTELTTKQAGEMSTSAAGGIKNEPDPLNKVDDQERGRKCTRCGDPRHHPDKCFYKDEVCYGCNKRGHISRVCRDKKKKDKSQEKKQDKKPGKPSHSQKNVSHEGAEGGDGENSKDSSDGGDLYSLPFYHVECESGEEEYHVYRCEIRREDPFYHSMSLSGRKVTFEVDTGASLTVIGHEQFKRQFKGEKLESTNVLLKTYTGEKIRPVGRYDVSVMSQGRSMKLPLVVTPGDSPNLLGRNWLTRIRIDWNQVFCVNRVSQEQSPREIEDLQEEFEEVFRPELGTFKDVRVKIELQEGAEPKFMKARPVPYALKKPVEKELERLVEMGVYEPVPHSRWATPIVAVEETNKLRLCGDYSNTVNPRAKSDNYPVPKTEDLLATLSGGEKFSKLDLTGAYHQLLLEEESRECLTINTHKGLFQPRRLVFGVHLASGVFQRHIEQRLQHVARTVVRVDDILITGKDKEEHLRNLREVLQVCKKNGLRLKKEKCKFFMDEVDFLGYRINKEGVKPIKEKVQPIIEAPKPQDVTQVKSFLGMIQYYHRHLKGIATKLEPLHALLRKEVKWEWTAKQEEAFKVAKEALSGENLLIHYDPDLPLVVHTDASPYGLGGVLSHVMKDGSERPVAYISRTLSRHERNYSQIEKEGLAVVYAVKKFHQYLYGRKFEIVTDHKPLLGLLGEYKPISVTAASRIQRWALLLSAYNYSLKYRKGSDNANADALSRLPQRATSNEVSGKEQTIQMVKMDRAPVNSVDVARETRKDPVLSKIHDMVLEGWPEKEQIDESWKPYEARKTELSVEAGVVMWGNRVIVPPTLRKQVLQELHEAHTGVCKMKALARCYVWWPKMDSQIESVTASCESCLANRANPEKSTVHTWETPSGVWERLHIDYAGPFMGCMFLIVSDAYSKWLDVYVTKGSTTAETVEKLRHSFAIHGIPSVIVSDNGTCFTSKEFNDFCQKNDIRHVTSAPYHPSTNGLAERSVRTFKETLKKWKNDEDTVQTKVERFLFAYRNTPHATTGLSPAQVLLKRRPRTPLLSVKPSGRKICADKQPNKIREFELGESVMARNYSRGDKWVAGQVERRTGPLSYHVQVDGQVVRRHADQLLGRKQEREEIVEVESDSEEDQVMERGVQKQEAPEVQEDQDLSLQADEDAPAAVQDPVEQPTTRRSERLQRGARKPAWMQDYHC